jgi:hypothetical protein
MKKDYPISKSRKLLIFDRTWSEMVNFMAVTTVVRLRADGLDKAARKSGRRR